MRWFVWSQKPVRDGEGFKQITRVDNWRASMPWAKDGLIVTTGNCRYMQELDRWREMGYRIFSPTAASAALEIDRGTGMAAMKAAGIEVPPYQEFGSFAEAEAFARKSDKCWVFKPLGDEEDKSLTFVSCDPAEMVGWLQRQQAGGKKLKGRCMLQEKLDMIGEISVSGWHGPGGFLPPKQLCFEYKKLMPGDVGPNTGEMGSVTQYVDNDKLANEALLPMAGTLKATGHTGDFCISGGVDAKGKFWPFEFTARLGWPAFYIQIASHKGDPVKWMRDLLDGKDSLRVSYDTAVGVVCAQPLFPYNKSSPDLVEGNPIAGIDDVLDDVHFAAVMRGKGPVMKSGKVADAPIYQTSGEYVLICTSLGKTVEAARKKVYRVVDAVKFANMMYRDDIGASLEKRLPALQKFGYAKGMTYA